MGSTPPPLPNSPPPVETPPPSQALAANAPGTQRLDMLLGNTGPGKSKPKSETPTKRRVSFMPEEASVETNESAKCDDNDNNITQEDLDRLNAKEDPNAFIHEAETLLNSATMGLSKMDFKNVDGTTRKEIECRETTRRCKAQFQGENEAFCTRGWRKYSQGQSKDF